MKKILKINDFYIINILVILIKNWFNFVHYITMKLLNHYITFKKLLT